MYLYIDVHFIEGNEDKHANEERIENTATKKYIKFTYIHPLSKALCPIYLTKSCNKVVFLLISSSSSSQPLIHRIF